MTRLKIDILADDEDGARTILHALYALAADSSRGCGEWSVGRDYGNGVATVTREADDDGANAAPQTGAERA